MKKIVIVMTLISFVSVKSFATYSTDWIKPAGDYLKTGAMIARDKSDNVVVTGFIQNENIYTRKYDKFGNFLWERISSSTIDDNYEKPVWVNCDKSKNIYVVGYRYSISSGWEYPNAVVVLKYNSGGTLLWKENIDLSYVVGSSTGLRFNLRSDLDSKGNLYIATAGTNPAGFVLLKLRPSGTVVVNTSVNLGIIHGFNSMRLKGNKVVATGTSTYNQNLAVVTWDTTGALLWSKTIEDSFTGIDAELDGSGNAFILTSYPNQVNGSSGNDFVIYKFNSSGVQTWKKSYDFGGEELATRFTLVSNKLTVIGYGTLSNLYLDWVTFQLTANGALLWNARYDKTSANDEQSYFLSAKNNGEVFITGKGGPLYTLPNGSSYLRMITLKYSKTGALEWVDSVNVYSGWGIACTLASDSSLFVLSGTEMTAFHFLDHTGTGTCGIPPVINVTAVTDSSAKFTWTAVTGAYLYHLQYKTAAAADWTKVSTNLTSIKIKTLTAGTTYNYQVEAICNSGPSGYTSSQSFTTTGTGYCSTGGASTAQEYLILVWIGSILNSTGNNNGYADFTNLSTNLVRGETIYGYLQAVLPWGESEHYSIWIDYNRDDDFDDAGEQAVNISSTYFGYIAVNFTIPLTASTGVTRMRVMQVYGETPVPCGSYARGETEDYTVVIVNERLTEEETIGISLQAFPNPFSNTITIVLNQEAIPGTLFLYDITGRMVKRFEASGPEMKVNWPELEAGVYLLRAERNGVLSEPLRIVKH